MNIFNPHEQAQEKIPTNGEVLGVIMRQAEKAVVVRELSDEQGLYFLEAEVKGEKLGEITRYEYCRKGHFPDGNKSTGTVIHVVFYEGDTAVGGHNIADFNSETGEWKYTT